MKLIPIDFDPFDSPADRIARRNGGRIGYADGGGPMTLQRTAPFPEAPEGYEFYAAPEGGVQQNTTGFVPGVGAEGVPSYEATPTVGVEPSTFAEKLLAPSKQQMEPSLFEAQLGHMTVPPEIEQRMATGEVQLLDSGALLDTKTMQEIPEQQLIPRMGVSPITWDASGKPELNMPKTLDIAGNIIGGPVPGVAGPVLGSGVARVARAEPRLPPPEPPIMVPHAEPKTPTEAAGPQGYPEGIQPGGAGRAASVAEAQRSAADAAGPVQPLESLPRAPLEIGGEFYVPGPLERVHRVAEQYMRDAGLPYEPMTEYMPVNVTRARSIARAFEEMPHDPNNPEVKAAYDAMIKETVDQLHALQRDNLKIEFIKPGMKDPYYDSPRMATKDLRDNNHLWVFPTDLGFGTEHTITNNPLLAKTGIVIDGHELLANDAFRIVHDYFGHFKDGVGFRAAGEENAWRSHSRMYSPLARKAMTTETRGQNSWLNYGPHGAKNRTAKSDQTVFADQKIGLLPDWAVNEGAVTYKGAFPELSERFPDVPPPVAKIDKKKGTPFLGKGKPPKELEKFRSGVQRNIDEGKYDPYFDVSKRQDVNPEEFPYAQRTTEEAMPAKQKTIENYEKIANAPAVEARLTKAYEVGKKSPLAQGWYKMGQLFKEFVAELGPVEGRKAFQEKFGRSMAATTGGSSPQQNLLTSQYANYLRTRGLPYPKESYEIPYPIGGGKYGVMPNIEQHEKIMGKGKISAGDNPKRHNFEANFMGHFDRVTLDEQMTRLFMPDKSLPPPGSYGVFEAALARIAAKHGVDPREFQEVAWAGHKAMTDPSYIAHPMIQTVNEAIERTHQVTGMPRAEIVRRGLVRSEIPIYGRAGFHLGLYSAVERAVDAIGQPKASAQQWLSTIRNAPGVKPDELKWMGLEDFLKEQKGPVTKQQVLDHIRDNQVQVQEVMKGSALPEGHQLWQPTEGQWQIVAPSGASRNISAEEAAKYSAGQSGPTKFQGRQLPGGENYREMLLTLPPKEKTGGWSIRPNPEVEGEFEVLDQYGRVKYGTTEQADAQKYIQDQNAIDARSDAFKSTHYEEPNILAHVRFNDRTIDGKKTLFVEEVQSDWHQKGRKEGYRQKVSEKDRPAAITKLHEMEAQLDNMAPDATGRVEFSRDVERLRDQITGSRGVPDAPFKTTWPDLAMKRIIRYAAENGYDKVAWTPGDVQAARYDLSKHIDSIDWAKTGDKFQFYADKNGQAVMQKDGLSPEELADHVGKDVAEKIVSLSKKKGGGKLSGLDLKVGGEGMKGFYDQILPASVNKLVKKYGARVGQSDIGGGQGWYAEERDGFHGPFPSRDTAIEFVHRNGINAKIRQATEPSKQVHSLDITPQLRKVAIEQGFPQFARGGAVKVAKPSIKLVQVAHDPFEVHNAIRRAMHGHKSP